jgi:hypothetical protein
MIRSVAVLVLSTLPALPALAGERPAAAPGSAPAAGLAPALSVVTAPFRLFGIVRQFFDPKTPVPLRMEPMPMPEKEKLPIRQPGDPDSVISPGGPTPSKHIALRPAFEVNDLLLKAYQPDPTVDPHDNRTRGAGAFSPLDAGGRPYQFRFGARLVW